MNSACYRPHEANFTWMDKVTLSGYMGKAGDPIALRAHDDFD
jgi:hypothetical protein